LIIVPYTLTYFFTSKGMGILSANLTRVISLSCNFTHMPITKQYNRVIEYFGKSLKVIRTGILEYGVWIPRIMSL